MYFYLIFLIMLVLILILLIFIILLFYSLILGVMTIVERKLLGIIQSRVSVYKFIFLGVYQFYLDFIKVLFKGFLSVYFIKVLFYLFILFIFFILNFIYFLFSWFILFLYIDFELSYLFLYLLILFDCCIFFIKVLFIFYFNFKFSNYFLYRIKFIYIFLEAFFLFFILFLYWLMYFLNYNEFIFYFIILFYFIIFILKMFRTPFDYFELESELVGGVGLEVSSFGFLLWSLIEYGLILNNILFLIFIIKILIKFLLVFKLLIFLVLFYLFLTLLIFIRGSFIRVGFLSFIYFLIFIYFLFNFIIYFIYSYYYFMHIFYYFNYIILAPVYFSLGLLLNSISILICLVLLFNFLYKILHPTLIQTKIILYTFLSYFLKEIIFKLLCMFFIFIKFNNPFYYFYFLVLCIENIFDYYHKMLNKYKSNGDVKLLSFYLLPILIVISYLCLLSFVINPLICSTTLIEPIKNVILYFKNFLNSIWILNILILFLRLFSFRISEFLVKILKTWVEFINIFLLCWCESGNYYERFFSMSREDFINSNLNKNNYIKMYPHRIPSKEFKFVEGGFDRIYIIVFTNLFNKSISLLFFYFYNILPPYLFKIFFVFIFFVFFILFILFVFIPVYIYTIYSNNRKEGLYYSTITISIICDNLRSGLALTRILFNVYINTICCLGFNSLIPSKFYCKYISNFSNSNNFFYYNLFYYLLTGCFINTIIFIIFFRYNKHVRFFTLNFFNNKFVFTISKWINFLFSFSSEIFKEEIDLISDNYSGKKGGRFNFPKNFRFLHTFFFERFLYFRIFIVDLTTQHLLLFYIIFTVIWGFSNILFMGEVYMKILIDFLVEFDKDSEEFLEPYKKNNKFLYYFC